MNILAMETGIGGGSLSVFNEGKLVDFRIGNNHFGRTEFFSSSIAEILTENRLERSDLKQIVYSETPGSQTGLKIGASLAKGLGLALRIPTKPKDLYTSVFESINREGLQGVRIILPFSRTGFEWKVFDSAGNCIRFGQAGFDGSRSGDINFLSDKKLMQTYIPLGLFREREAVRRFFGPEWKEALVDLGENLSSYLGLGEYARFKKTLDK